MRSPVPAPKSLISLAIPALAVLALGCEGEGSTGLAQASDRSSYPGYGKTEGAILAPLAFETPEGEPFSIADIYADPQNRILLLSTSAGWCTACIEEQPKLVALHEEFAERGLFLLITLFEDDQFQPADAGLARQWKRRYDLPFSVVADAGFQLGDYYDRALTPMTMLVNIDTMQILKISTGFPESEVRAVLNAAL